MIFGSQTHPSLVRYTHTFATFVRACGDNSNPQALTLDAITISWLPRSVKLHPLSPFAEEGVNLDLRATLDYVLCNRECVSMWGPYEISPELFCLAERRQAYLTSGASRYKVVDRIRRPKVLDCVHAVSGVDPGPGRLHTRTAHGDSASYFVLQHFSRWIIQPEFTHDWLMDRLCLETYPITRRNFCAVPASLLPILRPYYTKDPG